MKKKEKRKFFLCVCIEYWCSYLASVIYRGHAEIMKVVEEGLEVVVVAVGEG